MNINLITITAIFIFFIGSFEANAQKDTVFTKISTEYGTLEQQEMATEADRLFGTHVPSKWVIKFANTISSEGVVPNGTTQFSSLNEVGVEFKIKPSISLGINYSNDKALFDFTDTQFAHLLQFEERWYYKMAKRNAQGKGANNMTGRYLGLQQNIVFNRNVFDFLDPRRTEYGLSVRYGIQNRFKKHGFFDFSAGLGYGFAPSKTGYNIRRFSLDQSFRIGLGIFDNNKEADFSGNYCSVLRCFNENKRMWKINFLGVLQAGSWSDGTSGTPYGTWSSGSSGESYTDNYVSITPNIAFEQKLGDKPFSVEVSTNLTLSERRNTSRVFVDNPTSLGGQGISNLANLEFRWYYNQNRRIAKGKSGNTLIGPFMAVNSEYSMVYQKVPALNIRQRQDEISYNLLWGYQLRVFKHGYAQFRIGGGINNVLLENQRRELNLVGDVKVGYAF
jgi:Protein of unknown function (DUF3575)